MTILTEGARNAEFLVSEANDWRSRDEVTVTATGGALVSGTVLGKITASGKYVLHDNAAVDGSENAAAILLIEIGAVEDVRTIIARDAEVSGADLTYKAGITTPNKTAAIAALAALGIIVR